MGSGNSRKIILLTKDVKNLIKFAKNTQIVSLSLSRKLKVLTLRKLTKENIWFQPILPPPNLCGLSEKESSWTMGELYSQHKDADGFLYIAYSGENTFGN